MAREAGWAEPDILVRQLIARVSALRLMADRAFIFHSKYNVENWVDR
jgi:hypothetical protein